MTNERRKLSPTEEIKICSQVNNACPLSGKPLFERKNDREYKRYEIAHIYPLNPTEVERRLLEHEEKLSDDPNSIDNLIPLNIDEHRRFDKPRTVDEYRKLSGIKKKIISEEVSRSAMPMFALEEDIATVIESLCGEDIAGDSLLTYDAKSIDDKLDATMENITKRRIKNDVSQYYLFIKERFKEMEGVSPNASELISTQVRAYYLKQKITTSNQQEVFAGVVSWLVFRAKPSMNGSAEIIAAYFVQNCEVFE